MVPQRVMQTLVSCLDSIAATRLDPDSNDFLGRYSYLTISFTGVRIISSQILFRVSCSPFSGGTPPINQLLPQKISDFFFPK